jgi:DNA-binding transcriptional MerR regulator
MQNVRTMTFGPADAARRMRVTVKALRHYEKRGLLKPKRARNGWRVYDRTDLSRLERILAFKAMGFGLAQIASLLDATPDALAEALATQEFRLKGEVRKLNDALDAVRTMRGRPAPARSGAPLALAA